MANTRPGDIIDYRNAEGHGWKMYRLDGVLFVYQENKTLEENIANIRRVQDFQLRDDDILIAAYPKCGTHWLWEIVTMIMNGSAEYSKYQKEFTMLEAPAFGKLTEMSSPRVLNSHRYFRHLPSQLVEKKIKIIQIMRNPKDVSVSSYHHLHGIKPPLGFQGSYAEFAELFLDGKVPMGSYFDYIKDWTKVQQMQPDLLLLNIFYEDLKTKPAEIIGQVSEFLCKPASPTLCRAIADACVFDKLKNSVKNVKQDIPDRKELYKDGFAGLYRKGQIGDWKNWLSVAQNEAFDDVIQREMKDTGIEFMF